VENNRVDGNLAMSRAMGDYVYKQNSKLAPSLQKVVAEAEVTEDVVVQVITKFYESFLHISSFTSRKTINTKRISTKFLN
jgi:hypothetical protein